MNGVVRAPGYVAEFICIADKCEDTCCKSWDINIDKEHYLKLSECFENNNEELTFTSSINVTNISEKKYAKINFTDEGFCPFLSKSGLCDIHVKYGEDVLGLTCYSYPKVISTIDESAEIAGSLSCPEMVRKCLRQPLTDVYESNIDVAIKNEHVIRTINSTSHYEKSFPWLRDDLIRFFSDNKYNLKEKMLSLAKFSNECSSYYFNGTELDHVSRLKKSVDKLYEDDSYLYVKNAIESYHMDEPINMMLIQAVIELRVRHAPNEKFSLLSVNALNKYMSRDASPENLLPPLELWTLYENKIKLIASERLKEIDAYIEKYIQNCLYREWYIGFPDLFDYVYLLFIRVAVIRFLLVTECAEIKDPNGMIENVAVEIIYSFARAIEHDVGFQEEVYKALREQELVNIDNIMPFILM